MSPLLLCYPSSIVVVNSCHPSTLQADARSGGGGACRHRHRLSIVIVDSHHPSTLQADAHSGGGGACRHCCCAICRPLSLLIATAHPPCKQTLAAVVVVLVIVVVICPLSLSIATTHPPCKQMLAVVVVVLITIVVTQCWHSTHKQLLEELDAGGVMLYCQKIMLQRLRH